ncbi:MULTISPECIES: hypothetical protein [unclassified Pseudoalteromonas]|uniref:hypothetical protein n=1 Tax=unclassified Pseudoalteromonas TaxID=194690 RepID=UPI00209828F1|nr:hypothetical protein [Pseudoalteromonas sp. XMcav2-N]MCO7186799.1 hypothetical protein [Pseudoalteromonas sp. XMcav2-N]
MKTLYSLVSAVSLLVSTQAGAAVVTDSGVKKHAMETSTLNILYMGNSHTKRHSVPEFVKAIIEASEPGVQVSYQMAPGILFLDQRWDHGPSRKMLKDTSLSHVVLQAQKYSQSRRKLYSTKEAKKLVALAKEHGTQAVMFPEWGQRGRQWEGQYVHDIYAGIAKESGACIAPVGLVWDKFLSEHRMNLHAMDGNHANDKGAFLAALVLSQSILGRPADQLAVTTTAPVDAKLQQQMQQAAASLFKAEATACTS